MRRTDHPAVGLCLDSFHVLSRGSDLALIRTIPGEKIFFLQLADAPRLHMDVLQWSRHHRLFPGQGAFVGHVLAAGYRGPLSLEVFNDGFRQSDPKRAAVDAMRSLLGLEESLDEPSPPAPELTGQAFTELAVDATTGPRLAAALRAMGFAHTGRHRSKPGALWTQGAARVLLNETGGTTAVGALAVDSADPACSRRARSRSTRRYCPGGTARTRRTCRRSPPRTAPRCSSAAPAGWPTSLRPEPPLTARA